VADALIDYLLHLPGNEAVRSINPLVAVIEATEEAVYNSLFRATTMNGYGHTVEALPLDHTVEILRRYGTVQDRLILPAAVLPLRPPSGPPAPSTERG
jgi:hypothetical protein